MWKGPERELGPKEKHSLTVQTCIWRKRRPKQMAFIWRLERDLTSRLVVLSERSLTMQRRSPEARFEMKRTKMPSPDTTKSVCNYLSKEFQIFFQTLLSLSSMASKVFLKTQFQEGSFKSPLAATSIVENISYGIKETKLQTTQDFLLYELGARAKSLQDS